MADPSERDVLCARLTMLAIRASIPEDVHVSGDRWRLSRQGPDLSPATAEAQLAGMTRPIECYGDVEDGVTVIVVKSLAHRGFAFFTSSFRGSFGADYGDKPVLCVGRDAEMVVTFNEFVDWQETHCCHTSGHGSTPVDIDIVPPEARTEADRRDVVYIWTFTPNRRTDPIRDRIHITKFSTVNRPICGECREYPAMYTVWYYMAASRERDFCQRCIDNRMTVLEFDHGRGVARLETELALLERTASREVLVERAAELAQWWALKWKPPFMRRFIEKYAG